MKASEGLDAPGRIDKVRGDTRWARVDDVELAYQEHGEGEPLLLVSAYCLNKELWDPRFVSLLSSRYRVITLDNRGMGKSGTGTARWSIDRFAADAAGLLDALGIERAHVLGWSLGGDVALAMAVRFPQKVDRLVVYAGDCGGSEKVPPPRFRDILKEVFEDGRANGWLPLGGVFANLFPTDWMRHHPGYWRNVPWLQFKVRPINFARQNRAYNEWEGVCDLLPGIGADTLVVSGTEDVSTPPQNALMLADRIPGARLVLVPDAGHGLVYQYPLALAECVRDFLSAGPGEGVAMRLPSEEWRRGATVIPALGPA